MFFAPFSFRVTNVNPGGLHARPRRAVPIYTRRPDRMIPRAYRHLKVLLVVALALPGMTGVGAQDELRQRQKEFAESELRFLAEKAKAEGKTTVTFTRGFHHELI